MRDANSKNGFVGPVVVFAFVLLVTGLYFVGLRNLVFDAPQSDDPTTRNVEPGPSDDSRPAPTRDQKDPVDHPNIPEKTLHRLAPRSPELRTEVSGLSFDGVDDVVRVPAAALASLNSITDAMTIEAWVYPTSLGRFDRIVDRSDNIVDDRFLLALGPQGAQFNVNRVIAQGGNIQTNRWTHVAGVLEQGMVKLYVDGQLIAYRPMVRPVNVKTADLYIGGNKTRDRQFTGIIGEVRIWNVARTADEIAQGMQLAPSGTESGLIAFWTFDETPGQTVASATADGLIGFLGDSAEKEPSDPEWIQRLPTEPHE